MVRLRARRVLRVALAVALCAAPPATAAITDPGSTVDGARGERGGRAIAYVGTVRDTSDLHAAGLGRAGAWFAHFDGPPGGGRPTDAHALDLLPTWVAAFNHTESPADPGCTAEDDLTRGCLPTYAFRTFSQDGPARAAGDDGWAVLRLPVGPGGGPARCGVAGAIVDPHTWADDQQEGNTNNTVNRVQLQDGVPRTFFVGVVTDTTAGAHDPGRLAIRGNVGLLDHPDGRSQVEPAREPTRLDLAGNGIADVHVFRVDGFAPGDYLKLRLEGDRSPASFAGLVFDETVPPGLRRPDHAGGSRVPRCA